jgi:hypothetical protein
MASVNEGVPQAKNMMFVVWITRFVQLLGQIIIADIETKRRRGLASSRIVTSIMLWLKYAGLFFTTLTATIS